MNLSPLPIQKFFDNNGRPLVGGLLFTYKAGTSDKIATYSDEAGTPNTNPVVLDYRGEANVWLDQTLTYKFVLSPANDTDPPTSPIWSIDDISAALTYASLTASIIGSVLYPISPAEQAAGLTNNDLNRIYPYGNLARFKCDLTGGTANDVQIANAIAAAVALTGIGYVYHPGGVIQHAATINVPNGITIFGNDRNACEFTCTGTGSGWNNVNNPALLSGYGKVRFQGIKLTATNAANVGAAIELNAGGFSYYEIIDCWLFNKWKFGVILDAAELVTVGRNIIDLAGTLSGQIGIWIVNGPDRAPTQQPGFSNVITIRDNQISGNGLGITGTCIGVADDGGNNRIIEGNNFNNHILPLRVAGANSFNLIGNSLETHAAKGSATAQFTNLSLSGVNVGQATNGVIHGNGFFCDQVAVSNNLIFISQTYTITNITQAASAVVTVSTASAANPFAIPFSNGQPVTFQGVVGMTQINGLAGFVTALGGTSGAWTATIQINTTTFTAYASGGNLSHFHSGLSVTGNIFGYTLGRGAAIDVMQLASSFCGYNFDLAQSPGMGHYTNAHNDLSGNTLLAPQNGSMVSLGITGPTYGDARYPQVYKQGRVESRVVVVYSASMTIDLSIATQFQITATNATAFTILNPSNSQIGAIFTVEIRNTSGGALGAVTWNPSYKLAAWTQPANGFSRSITYQVDSIGNAVEVSRTTVDVPN